MKGLILKDILGINSFIKFFLILVVLCAVIGLGMGNKGFSAGIATSMSIFIGGMMGFTSFAYDTAYGWDHYVLTLPCTRTQIVLAKYLFSLLITGIGAGISIALNLILTAFGVSESDEAMWLIIGLLGCMVGIFISVMIPLMLRFGPEKARIIVIIVFIVPFMLFAILGSEGGENGLTQMINNLIVWLPFAAIAALVVSFFISVRIYQKREV